ncbi:MAG: PilZ domain-containing protein [Myxococcaceae bacterium]
MPTARQSRTPLCLPVSVGRKMAALSTDVSTKGFCLEVMKPVAEGTPIDGYVLHGDRELDWRGEVVWVEQANPQASHWSRIGVKFTWMSPGLRALFSLEKRRRK